jgi:hypothetical protein
MILNKEDATYASNIFIDYFSNINRIDDYLRTIKLDRMKKFPSSLPGYGPEDEMFDSFDMHPEEMNFEVYEMDNSVFNNYLEITTSHAIEDSIPGKSLKWIVKETTTNKIVGFIRFGSPVINSKPRNEFLSQVPDLTRFNRHVIMGFIIVPTQPFGYNYLGGKLLALLCCSHKARETLNKKYNSNICLFETTSLYGSTKSSSQYDGLKPYLRFKGLTDSNFIPLLHDEVFSKLDYWFKEHNGKKGLVKENASSRKLKTQQKMVSIIKSSLKEFDVDQYSKFQSALKNALNLTEQKRFYMSDYGFSNVREVINGTQDVLIKNSVNFDKFYMENIIKWWKNKASTRYQTLKSEGRLRTELELWNKDMNIDIIR